jgi:hypothetical protein
MVMYKNRYFIKVIHLNMLIMLTVAIILSPITSIVIANGGEQVEYDEATLENWFISQMESTETILSTSPDIVLDVSSHSLILNMGVTTRLTTVDINNLELTFDGSNEIAVSGELSLLGKMPRFSCDIEIECALADKIPQIKSIRNLLIGGFEANWAIADLDAIAGYISEAIRNSGLKEDALGGNLTGMDIIDDGGARLEMSWAGGSSKRSAFEIQDKLDDATAQLIENINDYYQNGYDEGKWSIEVNISTDTLLIETECTYLGVTSGVENMDIAFDGLTATVNDAVICIGEREATLSGAGEISCIGYVPDLEITGIGINDGGLGFGDWIEEDAAINSAIRDALGRLASNIIEDTILRAGIETISDISIIDGKLRLRYGTGVLPLSPEVINEDGVIQEDQTLISTDGKSIANIPAGTTVLDNVGNPPLELTVEIEDTPPVPPSDGNAIGFAYDFKPDGITFDPGIEIVFSYDEDDLSAGASETDLKVYFWNGSNWEEILPCTVDVIKNEITVFADHFSCFQTMWMEPSPDPEPAPEPRSEAEFILSDFGLWPIEVYPGEDVHISVVVENVGRVKGSYNVKLKVDGEVENTEWVTLKAGKSEEVIFVVSRDEPDEYDVSVGKFKDSFVVLPGYSISGLEIKPNEVYPGEEIDISAIVKNMGEVTGDYTITLRIDEDKVSSETITLAAGKSERVHFKVVGDEPDVYKVEVNGLKSQFVVKSTVAKFSIYDLKVFPDEVIPGETVMISVQVTNVGDLEGSYLLILNVNEEREQSQEVKLGARETREVVFSITKNDSGTYNVMIEDLTGGFMVRESVIPPQLDEASWLSRYWWVVLISVIAVTLIISILWFRK